MDEILYHLESHPKHCNLGVQASEGGARFEPSTLLYCFWASALLMTAVPATLLTAFWLGDGFHSASHGFLGIFLGGAIYRDSIGLRNNTPSNGESNQKNMVDDMESGESIFGF